jgi:hypothetical protein
MPIYCYRCKNDHITEKFVAAMQPYISCKCDECGMKARRSFRDEQKNTDCVHNERWSDSMGVQPHQVAEAEKTFPGSTYNEEGQLLIKSRKHKKHEMKRRGYAEIG